MTVALAIVIACAAPAFAWWAGHREGYVAGLEDAARRVRRAVADTDRHPDDDVAASPVAGVPTTTETPSSPQIRSYTP